MRGAVEHRLALPCDGTAALALLARAVAAFAEAAGLEPRQEHDLGLVLEELVTNTVTHGHGVGRKAGPGAADRIDVALRRLRDGAVQMELRDRARPFNPLASDPVLSAAALEDRPSGGVGVAIVRRLTRDGSYRRADGCNVLVLHLRNPPPA